MAVLKVAENWKVYGAALAMLLPLSFSSASVTLGR